MKTKLAAYLLFIKATMLTSFSQILLKMGMERFAPDIISIASNLFLVTGIALYGIASIMVVYGLKQGELSVLYPVIATSYIWVAILAYFLMNEPVSRFRMLGIGSVVAGVIMIGIGGRK